jgi:A/G-specific adenine glycosylase
MIDEPSLSQFQTEILNYYQDFGRHDLPWRQPDAKNGYDSYKILVSEIMLQQTQVGRVIEKYQQFLCRFPSVEDLAVAELADVLRQWSGLGYNRRAKYLHETARVLMNAGNSLPDTQEALVKLPGIGPNTAGAILAYAFNKPSVFIETNIRTVYINYFFQAGQIVTDQAILELVALSLGAINPRQWYWALMDYGSYLKRTIGNPNSASKHYTKQSKFEGSRRQIRGQVVRLLSKRSYQFSELIGVISDERLADVLEDLKQERIIRIRNGLIGL